MTWRPLPDPDGYPPPRPLRDSLERLARAMGAGTTSQMSTLFEHWAEVVGQSVAAHSRPLTLRDGILTIAVDDPAWAMQLTYLEADLRRQVDAALSPGAVERIVVRVRR